MATKKTKKGTGESSIPSGCQSPEEEESTTTASVKKQGKAPLKQSFLTTRAGTLDYKRCLVLLGIEYRRHAYCGVQVKLPGKDWEDWSDTIDDHIYDMVQEACETYYYKSKHKFYKPIIVSKADRETVVKNLLHRPAFNPLKTYFEQIEESDEPIDLISEVFDLAFDLAIIERHSASMIKQYCIDFCSLIGKGVWLRTFCPGSSFPFFPILLGEQGSGKSLWCELLLPPEIAAYAFNRDLDMSVSNADRVAICQRAAIVECEEMMGHSRKDIADIKAFVSSPIAVVRMPYARRPQTEKKHYVPINTTNDENCLPIEPSGNRRWPMMPIKRKSEWTPTMVEIELPKKMNLLRAKFWGYIKHLVKTMGEDASYRHWTVTSRQIREELVDVATKRIFLIENAIDQLLEQPNPHNHDYVLTPEERRSGIPFDVPGNSNQRSIMKLLPKDVTSSRYTPQAIAKILHTVKGWKSLPDRPRIDGKRCTLVMPPKYDFEKFNYRHNADDGEVSNTIPDTVELPTGCESQDY